MATKASSNENLSVAVIDVGRPGKNLGWAVEGLRTDQGDDLDLCIDSESAALADGPVALGFEAPMFVPKRNQALTLTMARQGESGPGIGSRPFSAGAGASVLVTGLVVVPYVLARLRESAPRARATLDWRESLDRGGELLLFGAFVTSQRRGSGDQHIRDASAAAGEFLKRLSSDGGLTSSVTEPSCLNLLGAAMLRTGWADCVSVLGQECLVIRVE